MPWGFAAAGVGTLVGGALSASAATSAAKTQAAAANQASQLQYQAFEQTQANLKPFMNLGTGAGTALQIATGTNPALPGQGPAPPSWATSNAPITSDQASQLFQTMLGRQIPADYLQQLLTGGAGGTAQPASSVYQGIASSPEYQQLIAAGKVPGATQGTPAGNPLTAQLTAPFAATPGAQQAALAATPGYQFTLGQGEQAVQNSFAAQGLSKGGAGIKGAVNYAEGLAGTTYQQMFGNYLAQNQQIYNMLYNQTALGESAAATAGTQAIGATSNIGNTITSGAAATAAGTVGAANAISGGLNNIGTLGYLYGQQQGGFGPTAGGGGGLAAAVPGYSDQWGSIPGVVATPGVQAPS